MCPDQRDRGQSGRDRRARHRRARRANRRDRRARRRRGGRARRLPRPAYSSGRHRFAGAFPRAGARSQGGFGDRLARGRARRRDGGVRNAQHRSADDQRGRARRQARPREGPHALRLRLLGRRHARQCRRHSRTRAAAGRARGSRCSWAPRPGASWWPTTRGCWRS